MTIGSRFTYRPAAKRGPKVSNDFNAMMGELQGDLTSIVTEVNALGTEIDRVHLTRYLESAAVRAHTDRLIRDREVRNIFDAAAGDPITTVVDLRGFLGPDFEIVYPDGMDQDRRARIEPIYGQMILPYDNVVNRIYGVNPDTGEVVMPGNVEITVTGYNDGGGTVTSGTKKYAVNGNNQDYWIREVRFPVASDVDYVEADFLIELPQMYTAYANLISIHPFPLGWADLLELKYSTTTAAPSADIPSFSAVNCSSFQRYHFVDTAITQIQVKIRQRHAVEKDGFKRFYLGLQELLVQLVDFTKTDSDDASQSTYAHGAAVVRVDSPTGYDFEQITRFWSSPTYATTGNPTEAKIYYRIYVDEALTDLRWYSYSNPAPQSTAVDLSGEGFSSIYVLVSMEWESTSSVSPVLDAFALRYTVA